MEFTPAEAGKLIFTLFMGKINYRNNEAFSIKERFNIDVSHSEDLSLNFQTYMSI
jgi:hypothetical protein